MTSESGVASANETELSLREREVVRAGMLVLFRAVTG